MLYRECFKAGVDQVGHHHTAAKLTQCRLRPINFLLEQNYVQSHVSSAAARDWNLQFHLIRLMENITYTTEIQTESHHTHNYVNSY